MNNKETLVVTLNSKVKVLDEDNSVITFGPLNDNEVSLSLMVPELYVNDGIEKRGNRIAYTILILDLNRNTFIPYMSEQLTGLTTSPFLKNVTVTKPEKIQDEWVIMICKNHHPHGVTIKFTNDAEPKVLLDGVDINEIADGKREVIGLDMPIGMTIDKTEIKMQFLKDGETVSIIYKLEGEDVAGLKAKNAQLLDEVKKLRELLHRGPIVANVEPHVRERLKLGTIEVKPINPDNIL